MHTRSSIRNHLEYSIARVLLASLAHGPRPVSDRLARVYTWLLDRAVPRLRRVAMRNLEIAMPERSAVDRRAIADGVFRSIARMMVCFARLPRIGPDEVGQWIRYEGYEHFTAALAKGRGVLFATAHLGNWELSAYAHAMMSGPMHVVVRPLDNPLIDALVESRRTASGNLMIQKKNFVRGILKALAANQAVGILIDQNTSLEEGVFVNFFGVPASANAGFAKLAARTGAAVIPGFALWSSEENRYVLKFYKPVEITGDLAADSQRLHSQLESVIREYPDQWLWIHRRWKTRPPGSPSPY
ncbi:MAG: lysophospholipid acyltransferase family protein [Acidobacteriales bacterium]|nr:lysophospholipid acyltransferase family protein [Terriglobales bacterium]